MTTKLRTAAAGLLLGLGLTVAIASHAAPGDRTLAVPKTLGDAEKEAQEIDRKLGELEARGTKLAADSVVKERRSTARARAYARLVRAGLLPVAGGLEALVSHAMKLEAARRAIVTEIDALKELRREQAQIAEARDKLAGRRAIVVAQRDALAQAQAIVDEAEERKRAFERAFSTSSSAGDHVAVYGAGITVHEPSAPPVAGFSSMKGRVPFPIAGRAEVKAARRESASGPGVELRASAGSAVRAVFGGRVAFSATYGDYGRLVIVDHGDHYFTVYANLGSVDVKVGDELSSGARIGTVGDAPGGGSAVYFEIRHAAETLDPKPWLGL